MNLILLATENSESMSWPDAIFGIACLALVGFFFWLALRG